MKKTKFILIILLLLIFALSYSGCKGGNPFNFMIGKITKSVDKNKVSPGQKNSGGIGQASSTPKISQGTEITKTVASEVDSSKILESALGIERFHYSSGGRRDPFETLFKGRELNVENVKLVGTIWGPKGRFALLKEAGGTGYVVGIGDKIADGRVVDITSSSVTFQIRKFGVSSKVTLVLEEKEENLKK
ncbi:MAG: hypothetical protein B5M53_00345 [Candidatus Cloacimonas sp. 4484_209]|nr:MAG: hypothetical protein B5M53_00345 [Candidatus Cloacimonas sp. 4484_209]